MLGTASVTLYYASSNADDGELLLGPYMDVGVSGGEIIIMGYEYSTLDSNGLHTSGGKVDQHKFSIGYGFDIGAGPIEGHVGGGTTKKIGATYNIYDFFNTLKVQPNGPN